MNGTSIALRFDQYIHHSWQRCKSEYSLNPTRRCSPRFVAASDLERRRRLAGDIYAAVCAELESIGGILGDVMGVTFVDREAVILGFAGSQGFAQAARRLGLCPGVIWSESEQGTNGMGTCLAERAPVVIEQRQHFLRQNTVLSCCAVPILDGTGRLAGALNASTIGVLSSAPTMALLELIGRSIEHRTLLEGYRRKHFVLRFHERRELVSTIAGGILVINEGGAVVAVNRAALALLEVETHAGICERSSADLLGVDQLQLRRLAAHSADRPQLLSNGQHFALVQAPSERSPRPVGDAAPPSSNVLDDAEREALLMVLQRHGGNVSRAADELRVSRRTLHRKLQYHGLRREEMLD